MFLHHSMNLFVLVAIVFLCFFVLRASRRSKRGSPNTNTRDEKTLNEYEERILCQYLLQKVEQKGHDTHSYNQEKLTLRSLKYDLMRKKHMTEIEIDHHVESLRTRIRNISMVGR